MHLENEIDSVDSDLAQLRREYEWNRIDPSLPLRIAILFAAQGNITEALVFFRIVHRDYRPHTPQFIPHAETLVKAGRVADALGLINEGLVLAEGIQDEDLRLRLVALKGRIARAAAE